MEKFWEETRRFLLSKIPPIPTSPLYRTLIAIGTLYCIAPAFNLLSFAQIYLLRSHKALNRFSSPNGTSWALITGSSDGIGKGFAEELCSRGINVILHGRNESKLDTVRKQLLEQWPKRQTRILVLDASADASDDYKLQEAARSLEDIELRILVNNVGGNGSVTPLWAPLSARSSSDVGQFIDINARFATEITRVLLPGLVKHAQPSLILNVGSAISDYAVPYLSMYSAGKAYLATLSKSLRMEMKAEGHEVEVLHLQVGMVATERETDRVPGFMTPSARGFAKNALDVVGCRREEVWPWWQHAVQFGLIGAMPGWLREKVFMGIVEKERASTKREN
jgi:17beta-estradiol 17-dehydrogenase / very-long-chain 3-oxoacyl-CoA reductase